MCSVLFQFFLSKTAVTPGSRPRGVLTESMTNAERRGARRTVS